MKRRSPPGCSDLSGNDLPATGAAGRVLHGPVTTYGRTGRRQSFRPERYDKFGGWCMSSLVKFALVTEPGLSCLPCCRHQIWYPLTINRRFARLGTWLDRLN
ncbi:hypothetical protein BLAT2472_10293 [Burkholderia latens]